MKSGEILAKNRASDWPRPPARRRPLTSPSWWSSARVPVDTPPRLVPDRSPRRSREPARALAAASHRDDRDAKLVQRRENAIRFGRLTALR